MKKIIVKVQDGTNATIVEPVCIHHLSDLGEGVKEAVNDFVEANDGAVIPPVTIQAVELDKAEQSEEPAR